MLLEKTKTKAVFSDLVLTDAESFKRQLRPFKKIFTSLTVLLDEQKRQNQKLKIQDVNYREELAEQYLMLAQLLEKSNTIGDLCVNVTNLKHLLQERYKENIHRCDEQLKERKAEIMALQIGFVNAGTNAKVYVFPIDKTAFLESPDPQYYERLQYLIKKEFYAYDMLKCPSYLGFAFPIESSNKATELAAFMSEIMGISVIDVPVHKKGEDLKEFLEDSFPITGANDDLAHLIIVGTHAYIKGVYEDSVKKKLLPIPLSLAIIGKLMNAEPGVYFPGLSGSPIIGVDSVVCDYDFERIDSTEFSDKGAVLILDSGHVQGTSTPYNGDVIEYTSFLTMDVFVQLNRSLIQYANNAAHGSWGKEEEENLKHKLVLYFNKLKRKKIIERGVLQDAIEIEYDEEEKTVMITIAIKYKGVVNKFLYRIIGESNNLRLEG